MQQNERAYDAAARTRRDALQRAAPSTAGARSTTATLLGRPFRAVVKTFQVRVWRELRAAWTALDRDARAALAPLVTEELLGFE